jgi:NAD(P)-dependent dehydrogenase (short-subunit alcohol dehydrogenase family)
VSRGGVIITGAARGIGRATAELFAGQGWTVGVADIDAAECAVVAAALGGRAIPLHLDVAEQAAWIAALRRFVAHAGGLDLLVNNAGILISGPFQDQPIERHLSLIGINVIGTILGCHSARPYLAGRPGACIVNSKFAIRGLTEALNIEWQSDGIRVVDVMPLFVRTDMVQGMTARSFDRMGARLTPSDVARTVHAAATARNAPGKVHWPVGRMTGLMRRLVALAPDRLVRRMMSQTS